MFSDKLKELRVSHGYSMEKLAELYNNAYDGKLNKSTISRYENNLQEPLLTVVKNFANLFHVSMDYINDTTNIQSQPKNEEKLLTKYRLLNEDGQQRLDSTLDDLLKIDQYRKDHLQPDLGEIIERAEQKHAAKAKLVAKGGFKKYKEAPSDDEIEEIIRRADENERKKRS